jgi:hypothetical protein
MTQADRPASGPPLLTADEWSALKAICTVDARSFSQSAGKM